MSTMVAAGRRHLPRGWADLGRQLAIWFGFAILYQLARGFADRNPSKAFANGYHVARIWRRSVAHRLYELTFQNFVDQRHLLETAVSWTYWNSEFTVVGLAVLWVYLRRHETFVGFRNSILLANMIGLVRLRLRSDRSAADARRRLRRHHTVTGSSASLRTRTPRCRACTPPTR